jgi:ParB-like chromosome segregation protein Spo0J
MIVSERAPSPAERLALMLVVNTQRADLKVMERARAIQQLIEETKWTAAEVSTRLGGPSPASISKLLTLLVLPREIQDLIDSDRLAMSSGYSIATIQDGAERQRLVEGVLSGKLTRDKVAALTKSHRAARRNGSARPRAVRPRMNRIVFPVGPGRRITVSAPELSVESVTKWIGDLLAALRQADAGGLALEDVAQLSGKGVS